MMLKVIYAISVFFGIFILSNGATLPYQFFYGSLHRINKRYGDVDLNFQEDQSCKVIKFSKHAKFEESNIDKEEHDRSVQQQHADTWHKQHEKHKKISKILNESMIKELLCDPDEFYPKVTELEEDVRFSCSQVCQRCVPGSYSICYMKNKSFPGVAQTCLCTYSHEDPIKKATLSLRHAGFHKRSKKHV